MNKIEVILPSMGESIIEATILKWHKKVGDNVSFDETLLEIATDKVDSDIQSPGEGIITHVFYNVNEVVKVGSVLAIINGNQDGAGVIIEKKVDVPSPVAEAIKPNVQDQEVINTVPFVPLIPEANSADVNSVDPTEVAVDPQATKSYISPLVRNIAKAEGITEEEISELKGSGGEGRLMKNDIISYIENKRKVTPPQPNSGITPVKVTINEGDEIIQMDRMRKLIANHMVMSKQVSPHVTSFVEVDVTTIVNWRDKNKEAFLKKTGEKITYTPIFIEATVKAIKDFPNINVCLDGDNIIVKKDINIGMATALPNGNLIVPVIKKAQTLSLVGITSKVNELANKARTNKLSPDDVQDGTFTITNVGTFGNLTGTPIINQPQAAILAVGLIRKKPVVIETEDGDFIGIRQMMMLSLSYDHRIIDGFLGGSFLKRIADYLESFKEEK
jgi:2-oxoglutarate dehydrogenase E2 component (dihydrolipoamide succinyltransferase)